LEERAGERRSFLLSLLQSGGDRLVVYGDLRELGPEFPEHDPGE